MEGKEEEKEGQKEGSISIIYEKKIYFQTKRKKNSCQFFGGMCVIRAILIKGEPVISFDELVLYKN